MPASLTLVKTGEARLAPERPQDAAAVDRLVARAFGPGRFVKAVERLREGAAPCLDASWMAWIDGRPVGAVRLWPVSIGGRPALLLGPIAVDHAYRSLGLGGRLVEAACEAALANGWTLVLLVGDAPFFGPHGFSPAPAGVTLPGPVDPRRILLRELQPGAATELAGPVRAA